MPSVKKIKFSDKAILSFRKKKDTNFDRLYAKSNFRLDVREVPGISLTYKNIGRKYAVEAANRAAPGCTFDIVELHDDGEFHMPLDQVAYNKASGVNV